MFKQLHSKGWWVPVVRFAFVGVLLSLVIIGVAARMSGLIHGGQP